MAEQGPVQRHGTLTPHREVVGLAQALLDPAVGPQIEVVDADRQQDQVRLVPEALGPQGLDLLQRVVPPHAQVQDLVPGARPAVALVQECLQPRCIER